MAEKKCFSIRISRTDHLHDHVQRHLSGGPGRTSQDAYRTRLRSQPELEKSQPEFKSLGDVSREAGFPCDSLGGDKNCDETVHAVGQLGEYTSARDAEGNKTIWTIDDNTVIGLSA